MCTVKKKLEMKLNNRLGSTSCASVGIAVTFDTKGPWFKSIHQPILLRTTVY